MDGVSSGDNAKYYRARFYNLGSSSTLGVCKFTHSCFFLDCLFHFVNKQHEPTLNYLNDPIIMKY